MGDYIGEYYRGFKGDTRSLDYSSCKSQGGASRVSGLYP